MKFKSMTMKNFMRYKGVNQIEFSCDPVKNVTVILGDNTVGKTTIAQAFRWGLYGALLAERGKKQEDYQLLNNDVLAMMDANSRAHVSVTIEVEDDEKKYTILRDVEYTRAYPKMIAKDFHKRLSMKISEIGDSEEDGIDVEENKINELINELFPRNLSHYFLFDGERWNDVTVNGVRENIKESVHILTGLSSYQSAMWHLKDMGSNSVIKKFKSKIKGSGNIYDNLTKDLKAMETSIERYKNEIKVIDVNINNYNVKINQIEDYLEQNKDTEVLQQKYKQQLIVKRSQSERCITNYKMLVNSISDKAYMLFALPMIESASTLVKSVAGERRDIPHMRQGSIDTIIKNKCCICGTPILPGSHELQCLLEQRNFLPPADIGSLLHEFENKGKNWKNRVDSLYPELVEMARSVDCSTREYEDTCNEIKRIERSMEETVDFKEPRENLRNYKKELNQLSIKKGVLTGNIQSCQKRIETIESELRGQEAKDKENQIWNERLEIANAIYNKMSKEFSERERKTFLELNAQIQNNFDRMFNAKDKKIQLTEDYIIQMLYRTEQGFREEKNLSEGEKIARNFAFIVTIMEYSRIKKAEKLGMESSDSDTLPLVLDGPFSKLGDENIHLIAKVLPDTSEQIIIFMLKKDWKYTGLDDFVGASYQIDKDAEQAYASIRRTGGVM